VRRTGGLIVFGAGMIETINGIFFVETTKGGHLAAF
jgi:hypothetical protein